MTKSKTRNFTSKPYPMNISGQNRGLALIFSHIKFRTGDPPRKAAEVDNDRLKSLLESFGFEVQIYLDYRKMQILQELSKVSKMDHSNHDCLAIFVMTHGSPDILTAYDGYYGINNLWYNFKKTECPTLKGKPKLFFIQACRGDNADAGIDLQYKSKNYNQPSPSLSSSPSSTSPDPNFLVKPPLKSDVKVNEIAVELGASPDEPDFLVAYAAVPGYYSYRDVNKGSWFIQGFCDVFEQSGKKYDLLTLLTFVAQKIAIDHNAVSPKAYINNKKQMPCIVSTLERPLFFFPEEAEEVSANLRLP